MTVYFLKLLFDISSSMKFFAFVFLFFIVSEASSQSVDYECPCAQIGLDNQWADSNKVSCYSIPVLRDVTNKNKGTFQMAVVVAAALGKSSEKPLLYLHGGPGIATISNVPRYLKSATWNMMRQDRALVFFDYRGTGYSEPDLCPGTGDSLARLAAKNLSPAELQASKLALFKSCREQHAKEGIDIASFSSYQSAEDAENIRKVLELDQWNVYGVSHGTTVALNLLRNHESSIHSMILDSPFPPNAPWLDFVRPFAVTFQVLESRMKEDPKTYSGFSSLRKNFIKAVDRLNQTPFQMVIDEKGNTFPFTGNDFSWSIWTAMLKPRTIPLVPLAIQETANGNDSVLKHWIMSFSNADQFGRFSEFQSKAILCYEGRPRNVMDRKEALQAKYPEFAAFNLDFEDELCNTWQPGSAGVENFEAVRSKVPVLILSGEYDPVCPPVFGELTASTLVNSVFVNVPAASHAAIHEDDCTRTIAQNFLENPFKKLDLSCISTRAGIKFITSDLVKALKDMK